MPTPSPDTSFDVVGIGNAIVDILAHASDEFVAEQGLVPGSMNLIDTPRAEQLYAVMGPAVEMSGGCAGNTVAGVASFGGRAAFIGKVRNDQLGQVYRHDSRALGISFDVPAAVDGPPTARSFILMTPDGERTMNTYLGAAEGLLPRDIDLHVIERAGITYCEGFLWDADGARAAMKLAMGHARKTGRRTSFTLSDSFCVDRHHGDFLALAGGGVDILFANEAEIVALYGAADFGAAIATLQSAGCPLGFVTCGAAGSVIVTPEGVDSVEAFPVPHVVDTTGAGDLYAAGVLFGLATGRSHVDAARLGSLAAAEVISHVGARPEVSLRDLAEAEGLL